MLLVAVGASYITSVQIRRLDATPRPTGTSIPLGATYPLLSTAYAGAALFGLSGVRGVVNSAYAYEVNLLDGSPPVADIDYLLPSGAAEPVSLPGNPGDHFPWYGAVYVDGSGWVSKWATPNGGRFAFLHISTLDVQAPDLPTVMEPPPPSLPNVTPAASTDGDEQTARAVGNRSTLVPGFTLALYGPRTIVGRSGWPSWALYGNGSYGPVDAHLCFVLDARAAAWFYGLLTGRVHPQPTPTARPAPFPLRAWQHWCRAKRGRRCISPYDRRHHLTWPAAIFVQRRAALGGKTPGDRWWQKKGHVGFDVYPFEHRCVLAWPRYHTFKLMRQCPK